MFDTHTPCICALVSTCADQSFHVVQLDTVFLNMMLVSTFRSSHVSISLQNFYIFKSEAIDAMTIK